MTSLLNIATLQPGLSGNPFCEAKRNKKIAAEDGNCCHKNKKNKFQAKKTVFCGRSLYTIMRYILQISLMAKDLHKLHYHS